MVFFNFKLYSLYNKKHLLQTLIQRLLRYRVLLVWISVTNLNLIMIHVCVLPTTRFFSSQCCVVPSQYLKDYILLNKIVTRLINIVHHFRKWLFFLKLLMSVKSDFLPNIKHVLVVLKTTRKNVIIRLYLYNFHK